ncbi:MAG: hypothetical protein GOV02_04020 [Candidatus Aenigmarchaeota archaeon]|nr:hypothetical protein [Candidatus Aenigmarchaeota archaeon]
MGMEIKKNGNNLTVETDYGAGFIDHRNVHQDRNSINKYMKDFDKDSVGANDYDAVKDKMKDDYSQRKKEEKKRYDEWAREHSSRR